MENKEHIFAIPISYLYERLSALNGFVSILNNQLEAYRKETTKKFDGFDIEKSAIMAGYNLLVQDLTFDSNQQKIPFFPGGSFTRQGADYFSAGEELVTIWAGFTLAQVFEAFETFTRDQAATLFWLSPPESPVGNLRHIPIENSDYSAWQGFFREKRWNIFSILDLFRKQSPNLRSLEQSDILRLNLGEWLSLLATIRHAITHSNSVVTKDKIQITQSESNRLLHNYFPGVWEGDSYTLSITIKKAKRGIEIAASYAYLIYKTLAKSIRLDGVEIGPKD